MFLCIIFLLIQLISSTCTPGSCIYCNNDGAKKFCSSCGNGKYLTGKPGEGQCKGDIEIPNCWQVDAKNIKKCITCNRNFYLTKFNKCEKIHVSKCIAGSELNNQFYCSLCDGRNVSSDYKTCDSDTEKLPKNCMSGNIAGKGCLLCVRGYYPDAFSRECIENQNQGCGIYDTQLNCLECDTFHGFYAVDSAFINNRVFQTQCKYEGYSYYFYFIYFNLITLLYSIN